MGGNGKYVRMRRRAAGGLLAVLFTAGGGAAAWGTSTTTTEPPPPTTTTTTEPDTCSEGTCTAEPPAALLSARAGEIQAAQISYCWTDPDGDGARCVDMRPDQPLPVLAVRQGEALTLRFATSARPTEVLLSQDGGEPRPLAAGNPTTFVVDLPPGGHDVRFFTRWQQGDAAYGVRLDVSETVTEGEPPAAFLASATSEVNLARGSYCWRDGPAGRCADVIPDGRLPTLEVRRGETLTLRFATSAQPTELALSREGRAPTPIAASNPTRFNVGLPPGSHDLLLTSRWAQGDASYAVRLVVKAGTTPRTAGPAVPVPGQPRLAG